MIFNIRKKFFLLVFAVAFIGFGIYFYELPSTDDQLQLTDGRNEYHDEIIRNGKYEPGKKELFNEKTKNWKSSKESKYPSNEDQPERKYHSKKDKDLPTKYDAADAALMINQTFWEWLNLDENKTKGEEGIPRSVDYCRPREQVSHGAEGQTVHGFTLEHVHVLIRHGDRSPIYSLPRYGSAVLDCYLNYSKLPDEKLFWDYVTYMKTVWEVLGPETHGAKFGLYPRNKKCEGAQLTPQGVLQHLKNGEYLRKIYFNKWRLFGRDDVYSRFTIRTTDYTRTYQSALAFAYGFIPDFDYFKLKIKFSRLTNFCSRQLTQLKCECKTLYRLQASIEEEYTNRSRNSKLHNDIKHELAEIFDVETSRLPWIAAALDVIMGHFCHNQPLPCSKDREQCITHDLIRSMWKFLDFHGQAMQSSYANAKFARLTMHPLLMEIYSRMYNVTRGSERTKFYLYSGHDTTIAQLRTALGIHDGLWPPYASRLIFELYSGQQERNRYYFIRVLYNGLDLTRKLVFCRHKPTPHGLCPLEYFKNFSQHENLRAYGTTDYSTVCQP